MDLVPIEEIMLKDEKFEKLKESGFLIDINNIDSYLSRFNKKSSKPNPSYWAGKRVLVTGASGMVGSTIIDHLIEYDTKVFGTIRRHAIPYHPNINHYIKKQKIKTFEVDLRDYQRISNIIKEVEPHVIFHQASESFVPTSIEQPTYVTDNNCISTINILEAATKQDKELEALQLACSSEEIGFVKSFDELPIKETGNLRPTSPYALTKVFTEYAGKAYYYMYRTPTVLTRTFNQEGPRRPPQFFTGTIGLQISKCLVNENDKIVMGNPNAIRDMTHILDSSKAQLLAVEKCNKGEPYHICSGSGIRTGDYVELALRIFDLKNTKVFVDKKRLRTYERGDALFDGFIGDNTKISEKTGWRPTLSILDIIKDSVEFYR